MEKNTLFAIDRNSNEMLLRPFLDFFCYITLKLKLFISFIFLILQWNFSYLLDISPKNSHFNKYEFSDKNTRQATSWQEGEAAPVLLRNLIKRVLICVKMS